MRIQSNSSRSDSSLASAFASRRLIDSRRLLPTMMPTRGFVMAGLLLKTFGPDRERRANSTFGDGPEVRAPQVRIVEDLVGLPSAAIRPSSSRYARCAIVERHRDVLLDEQHRRARRVHVANRAEHRLHHERRQARATARRAAAAAVCAISARPIATICCWPPDSAPAGASSLSRTAGNSVQTAPANARAALRAAAA